MYQTIHNTLIELNCAFGRARQEGDKYWHEAAMQVCSHIITQVDLGESFPIIDWNQSGWRAPRLWLRLVYIQWAIKISIVVVGDLETAAQNINTN